MKKLITAVPAMLVFNMMTASAETYWGAWAWDPESHRDGWTNNFKSKQAAESRALDICGTQFCRVEMSYCCGWCFAISKTTDGTGYGISKRNDRGTASSAALTGCIDVNGRRDCQPARTACTYPDTND